MEQHIKVPMCKEDAARLQAGDYVYLTGTIYTARDAAHKRMYEALERGENLPLEIGNNIIYYMGPSPAREGRPIGSAGPTTASRMDKYAPALLDLGLLGMIGKGRRSDAVKEAIVRNGAVYFAAVGGVDVPVAGAQSREARLLAHLVGGLEESSQAELRHQDTVVELHQRYAGGSLINILRERGAANHRGQRGEADKDFSSHIRLFFRHGKIRTARPGRHYKNFG